MNCYVITLKNNYRDSKQYKSLINNGFNVIVVPGIIPNKESLDKYPLRPKVAIGIFLAHNNVWKRIVEDNDQMALILEDDAYPLVKLKEIEKIPKDYDILKLHDETGGGWSSLAAYIITNKTAKIFVNSFNVIFGHVDLDTLINCKLKGLKLQIHENLFKTDETYSTNRNDTNIKQTLFILYMDRYHKNTRGDKLHRDIYNYYGIRINDNDLTVREIVTLVITLVFLILLSCINNKSLLFIIYILFLFIFYFNLF